jgi:peptide/nickel transport system substrate-binding protein
VDVETSGPRWRALSRRAFLRRSVVAGLALPALGGLLSACSSAPPPAAAPAPTAAATAAPARPASPAAAASPVASAGTAASRSPAAAASPAAQAAPAQRPNTSTKDSIVVAQSQDIIALDPTQHTTYPTQNVLWHVYEPLVARAPGDKYAPHLATSWKVLNDTTWQFSLRPGVKFHNGEDFDANAVKFSFDRAMDPATKNRSAANLTALDRVEVVDPMTVNFVTKQPFPVLLYYLSEDGFSSVIVPPKYVQQNGADSLSKTAVGTGPYKFVRWAKDDRVELEVNPEYWGGAPPIKRVTFRAIPETAARIAELKSGGADLIDNVDPEQAQGLNGGSTRVATVPSDFVMFVALNTLEPGPLQDKRVRQALNYAVDVDSIVTNIMGGAAQRIAVSLPADAFGYPRDLQPYPYDPAKAKQLLQDAGQANGFTIPFISRDGRYLKDKEVVEAIGGYLSQIGVQTDIQLVTASVWSQISDKHDRKGLSYPGWSGPDAELVWDPILHSGGIQAYVDNKQIDQLIEQGRSTLDESKRLAIYSDLANLLKDEAVHIPLFQQALAYASVDKLSWTPHADSIIDLRTAAFT